MVSLNRGVSTEAARMIGDSAEFDSVMEQRKNRIRSLAPSRTGAFRDSIQMRKVPGKNGVVDREIYSDDPGALSIEFGHVTRDGTPVHGHFPFSRGIS